MCVCFTHMHLFYVHKRMFMLMARFGTCCQSPSSRGPRAYHGIAAALGQLLHQLIEREKAYGASLCSLSICPHSCSQLFLGLGQGRGQRFVWSHILILGDFLRRTISSQHSTTVGQVALHQRHAFGTFMNTVSQYLALFSSMAVWPVWPCAHA